MTGDQLLCLAHAELSSSPLATVANMLKTGFKNVQTSHLSPTPLHAKKIAVQFVMETAAQLLIHQLQLWLHPHLELVTVI